MRPLSPHLGIYKPQITSVLSISHRLSGIFLFIGILVLSWWTIFSIYETESCLNTLFQSIFGKVAIFAWSLALFYHMLNGVRHLFWDAGKGFELETLRISGILVFTGAIILTAISWFIALQ